MKEQSPFAGRRKGQAFWVWCERLFLAIGLLALGIYGGAFLHSVFYQAYDHWSFDQALRGQPAAVKGFLAHLAHIETTQKPSVPEAPGRKEGTAGLAGTPRQRPSSGDASPIGRMKIPAVGLSAMVLEGTDPWTLNRGVGHIEGTAYPGQQGNFGVAGHRDGYFRALRKISKNDTILLTTLKGTYQYRVDEMAVFDPNDVRPLAASSRPTLTLITCYPFYFVGAAPRRFIVTARLIQPE